MRAAGDKIFLVDDNVVNLAIGKNALIEKYQVFTMPSGEKLLKFMEKMLPDLILLDIEMPDMNGYEILKTLKSREETADIPVIFLTAKSDADNELEGLTLGAVDYITKPFSTPLLLKRIELHLLVEKQRKSLQNYNENLMQMVKEKTQTVLKLQTAILETVAELVECRDNITGAHIERTQSFLRALLSELMRNGPYREQVSTWDTEVFLQSALLHDVGKIMIRDSILGKPARLTAEEFEEMKTHTTFGVQIVEKISKTVQQDAFLEHARILAGAHHEKWDGSGYPLGLSGEDIPLQGRLMAIADVYDALISERPYKKAFSHAKALEIILSEKGTHFDPLLIDAFVKVSDQFSAILASSKEA